MRDLSLGEILELYRRVMAMSGGATGITRPWQTRRSALGFSLINNHPFVDGNKRVGHAAMEVMLLLNGFQIVADVDDQERTILAIAAGTLDRNGLGAWLNAHIVDG